MLKLEKFSGAHQIRHMLDAIRRGEDWNANNDIPSSTTTANADEAGIHVGGSGSPDIEHATLTDEQRERIARNEELARARRRQRELGNTNAPIPPNTTTSTHSGLFNDEDDEYLFEIEDEEDTPLQRTKNNKTGAPPTATTPYDIDTLPSLSSFPSPGTVTLSPSVEDDLEIEMDDDVSHSDSFVV